MNIKKYCLTALCVSVLFSSFFYSKNSLACAGGCGVSNVGTSSLIPNQDGGIVFLQYDEMNQTRNWHGENKSNAHNHDKKISTQRVTAGAQYMFNRDWGVAIRLPYVARSLENLPHHGDLTHTRHSSIGDIRINGIYSGFSDDMSTGITFGLKLPTGATKDSQFTRNTQIGTGSTDATFGAYHTGTFDKAGKIGYFAQGSWDRAFIRHRGYTPGYEISGATGVYYNFGKVGFAKKVAPIFQFSGSKKGQDSGWADSDHNPNSGYGMVFFNPGIEVAVNQFRLYADVGFPIYRQVNGTQLVPQNIYKVILGYNF